MRNTFSAKCDTIYWLKQQLEISKWNKGWLHFGKIYWIFIFRYYFIFYFWRIVKWFETITPFPFMVYTIKFLLPKNCSLIFLQIWFNTQHLVFSFIYWPYVFMSTLTNCAKALVYFKPIVILKLERNFEIRSYR